MAQNNCSPGVISLSSLYLLYDVVRSPDKDAHPTRRGFTYCPPDSVPGPDSL